ncbi:MAG: HEPN domain-containing protein [Burkholderiaceae bacterium]
MVEQLTSLQWVEAWLIKADHDLETADRALRAGAPITDTAAYHCHQAAEKALKAFLAWRGEPVAKTHDLMALLTRCAAADAQFSEWADKLTELSAFGTVLRYPSVDADPSVNDVTEALKVARQLNGFVATLTGAGRPCCSAT